MTSNTSLLTRGDRLWATSQQKEENRAPWWGYNKRSAAGWYLGHPRKGEHQSDALTFQSTTIDNNSSEAVEWQERWRCKVRKRIVVAVVLAVLIAASAYAQTTDFFALVKSGTPQDVQAAISKGADIKARDKANWTPLMVAAEYNKNPQ